MRSRRRRTPSSPPPHPAYGDEGGQQRGQERISRRKVIRRGSSRDHPTATSTGARFVGWRHERTLADLEGAVNARDLGGLPLAGRRDDRPRRPAALRQPPGPHARRRPPARRRPRRRGSSSTCGPGVEVELEGPGPLVRDGRAEIRHRSSTPRSGEHTDVDVDARDARGSSAAATAGAEETPAVARLPRLPARPPGLDRRRAARRRPRRRRGARALRGRQGPHRRGCALALAVAGATRAAIVGDYVATGERIGPLMARLRASPTYATTSTAARDEAHVPRARDHGARARRARRAPRRPARLARRARLRRRTTPPRCAPASPPSASVAPAAP